ncbi:MAG: hypothetical protein AAGJ70_06240 [Pseudomonadota bacterium]
MRQWFLVSLGLGLSACAGPQSVSGLSGSGLASGDIVGGTDEGVAAQGGPRSVAVETVAAIVIARNTGRPLPKAY